jgi:hypothetical protein
MINREDLNISSTMTKRATNLDKLKELESLLDKEVSDAEINLQRILMEQKISADYGKRTVDIE